MLLKILSYNTHKLFTLFQRNYFLKELKELLLQLDLDLVFLQEIRGEQTSGSSLEYPLESLADEIWDHFVYGKNAITDAGNHGNAILSKYPFKNWKNFDLSNHPLERRGLLLGEPEIPFLPNLKLYCTHLDLTMIGRLLQARKIKEIMDHQEPCPTILCGDFNDWTGVVSNQLASTSGLQVVRTAATFPSFLPVLKLDRVLFRGFKLIKCHTLSSRHWRALSDHLPVYLELESPTSLDHKKRG